MIIKIYRYTVVFGIVAIVLGLAFAMGSPLESLIAMLSFLILKQFYKFKYHCRSSIQCLLVTVIVFLLITRVTLSLGQSYLCCGILGLAVAHIAQHYAQLKFIKEDYEFIEPRYNELVQEKRCRDVHSMDEQSLRVLCREYSLDEIDEEIVVQRIIYRLKGSDLYTKIGYSKPQMIRREKRIEARLNIKLKDH